MYSVLEQAAVVEAYTDGSAAAASATAKYHKVKGVIVLR